MATTLGGGAVVVVSCGCEGPMGCCFLWLVWAADPFLEGLLDPIRRQGRPSGAGFAGRFAVLDSGPDRERFGWLSGRGPGCGAADPCLRKVRLMGRKGGPPGHLPSTDTRPFAHRENSG